MRVGELKRKKSSCVTIDERDLRLEEHERNNERENHGSHRLRLPRRRSSVRRRNRALRQTDAPQRPTARGHLPAVQDFVSLSKTQSLEERAPCRGRGHHPLLDLLESFQLFRSARAVNGRP